LFTCFCFLLFENYIYDVIQAFIAWLNETLKVRDLHVSDLVELSDGVVIYHFLEILSNKKITTKVELRPVNRIQKIQNLAIALKFFETEMGMRNPGCGAEGISFIQLLFLIQMIHEAVLVDDFPSQLSYSMLQISWILDPEESSWCWVFCGLCTESTELPSSHIKVRLLNDPWNCLSFICRQERGRGTVVVVQERYHWLHWCPDRELQVKVTLVDYKK
jgi:hypothetical protein